MSPPNGFDVPSGAALPARLERYKLVVLRFLKGRRLEENRGPDNPLFSNEVAAFVNTNFFEAITDVDIRALVNALRRDRLPIGSGSRGYFYALSIRELESTLHHLEDRKRGLQAAIDGLNGAFADKDEALL